MKKFVSLILSTLMFLSRLTVAHGAEIDQTTLVDLYDPDFEQTQAQVLSANEANAADTDIALVRQENGKIAFMVRGPGGEMEPFYPMSVETGFWDTRLVNNDAQDPSPCIQPDWDYVFEDIRSTGSNTVQVMIYWSDWEPEKGRYDYTLLDEIVDKAAANGLKTVFVIFFHSHTSPTISPKQDDFWAYHLDDRVDDGVEKNYSIMWGTGNYYSTQNFRKYGGRGTEIFLEYWHPEVFPRLMAAITDLAAHFRHSGDVLAYQLGNEEGFNYYVNNGNDQNPYYQAMFAKWKAQTGRTAERDFRLETVNRIWQSMNNAVHEADPYKPTTSNLQTALPEKNGGFDWNEGADINFYKNLDMAGPMFYKNAHTIYPNMDPHYRFATELPILYPTEIGVSVGLEGVSQKVYIAETLARGGQGFGLYCYGEFYNNQHYENGTPAPAKAYSTRMMELVRENQDIVWGGLPVSSVTTQNIFMTQSADEWARLPVLEKDQTAALGLLYFMGVVKDGAAKADKTRDVTITVKEPGTYTIDVMVSNGTTLEQETFTAEEPDGSYTVNVPTDNCNVAFIAVRKTGGPVTPPENVPADGTYRIRSAASRMYLTVSPNGEGNAVVQANYTDGETQLWTLTRNEEGYYSVCSSDERAMNIYGKQTRNEAPVVVFNYNGGENQQWQITQKEDGSFIFTNRNSGKCLDNGERNSETDENVQIIQKSASGAAAQQWWLEPVSALEPLETLE